MNKRKGVLVSVVITTYHNEKYLPRAIESVLRQSYPEIELIVVDDNPPESRERKATERVMQHYPQAIYLKHSENRNGAAARNTGICAASGEYIAFLDNDDVYFGGHIKKCAEILNRHPECGGVVCGVVKVREGICWERILPETGDFVKQLLFSETALGTGSNLFVRTELVREIGGFDESFLRHQDLEFAVRLYSEKQPFILQEVQIVKGMDGFSNTPDFDRFLAVKRHFMEKFQDKLAKLSEEEVKRYYAGQYSALLYSACVSGNRDKILWTVHRLRTYRNLKQKEILLLVLEKIHLFTMYEGFKRMVKKGKSGRLYREVAAGLASGDQKVLDDMMRG